MDKKIVLIAIDGSNHSEHAFKCKCKLCLRWKIILFALFYSDFLWLHHLSLKTPAVLVSNIHYYNFGRRLHLPMCVFITFDERGMFLTKITKVVVETSMCYARASSHVDPRQCWQTCHNTLFVLCMLSCVKELFVLITDEPYFNFYYVKTSKLVTVSHQNCNYWSNHRFVSSAPGTI